MKRQIKGKVISDKLDKTIIVCVDTRKTHPIYRKKYTSSKKFAAQNDIEAKKGDYVVLEESRPLSKNKRWTAVKTISAKKVGEE